MSGIERYVAGERASRRTSVGARLSLPLEGVALPFGVEVRAKRLALGGHNFLFQLLFGDFHGPLRHLGTEGVALLGTAPDGRALMAMLTRSPARKDSQSRLALGLEEISVLTNKTRCYL